MLTLIAALGFTSCIDETIPQDDTATGGQISSSTGSLISMANGIPAQMCQGYLVYGKQEDESDEAYPQMMIAQTELLGDMIPGGGNIGYDWFLPFNTLTYDLGPSSTNSFLPWYTMYKFVKSANAIIGLVNLNAPNVTAEEKAYVGAAYACRAFDYTMLMYLYEPVENIYTDVTKVKGLTVPIVTEKTTQDEAKNNPRATHDEMMQFILSDLDIAEECMADGNETGSPMLPGLAVVYGIRAKALMWDGDFENAAKYARMAIDTYGAEPMNETEWTDPTSAFAKHCDAWMWYIHNSPENMSNLANMTGMISNEATWSYGWYSKPCISRSLYDEIGDGDFRKQVFIDPDKNKYDYKTSLGTLKYFPKYGSLKFRCLNGDYTNYSIGGATDVPVMRVEEMYFIEALATAEAANGGLEAGKQLLNTFMKNYRDENFESKATTLREFELELIDQMRIEFWGEGNAFPLAKQFKVGVIQYYEGNNLPSSDRYGILKLNCKDIKPSWNFVIPQEEVQGNIALDGKNKPDPTNTVECPSPLGEYGAKKQQ